jgi:hypothetical protein
MPAPTLTMSHLSEARVTPSRRFAILPKRRFVEWPPSIDIAAYNACAFSALPGSLHRPQNGLNCVRGHCFALWHRPTILARTLNTQMTHHLGRRERQGQY